MNKKILLSAIVMLAISTVWAQTKEIYTNPQFYSLAKDHQVLAILPFAAQISLRPNQMRNMSAEDLDRLEESEGKAVQNALQTYFLKQKGKQNLYVSFQDISQTNALLAKNNINTANVESFTSKELAEILGVDGIIHGLLSTNKPMSDGASAAMGLITGFYGSTNSGKCAININDGNTGELLWKYEKTLSRSLGSDTNTVINAMMRKASKKFPYLR